MADREEKERQVERYLRQSKRHRSREEEQELQRRSRARRAEERPRGPRRRGRWEEDDEEAGRERMGGASARPARGGSLGPSGIAGAIPVGGAGEPADGEAREAPDLVVGLFAGRARVRRADGERVVAELAGELAQRQRSALAVGDRVRLEERGDGHLRLVAVAPRRSVLARADPGRPGRERVLAANVDVAVVVGSLRRPTLRPRLFDRFLVALERGGVQPLLCVSKLDLARDGDRERLARVLAPYRALGVAVVLASAESGEGVAELAARLAGRTCVFVGQSGVGKSSLLNALDPTLALRTRAVRDGDGKGRHTTTASALFELEGLGGPDAPPTRLIDTPGVRAFGIDVAAAELSTLFPELAALGPSCRFRDCSHVHEPACAVRAAAEAGELAPARYEAYLRIRASLRR